MSYAKFTGHLPPNLDYMSWAKYNILGRSTVILFTFLRLRSAQTLIFIFGRCAAIFDSLPLTQGQNTPQIFYGRARPWEGTKNTPEFSRASATVGRHPKCQPILFRRVRPWAGIQLETLVGRAQPCAGTLHGMAMARCHVCMLTCTRTLHGDNDSYVVVCGGHVHVRS